MGLFGYKNNNREFIAIESFCKQIDSLFSLDKFIFRKDYISFYDETIDIYKELIKSSRSAYENTIYIIR